MQQTTESMITLLLNEDILQTQLHCRQDWIYDYFLYVILNSLDLSPAEYTCSPLHLAEFHSFQPIKEQTQAGSGNNLNNNDL